MGSGPSPPTIPSAKALVAVEEATWEAGAKAEAEPTRAVSTAAVFMVKMFVFSLDRDAIQQEAMRFDVTSTFPSEGSVRAVAYKSNVAPQDLFNLKISQTLGT